MNLVIVESPTKAKTISKFLGKEYSVESSYGHVRDLPKSNKDAVDISAGFAPRYVIPQKKEEAVERLKKLALKADEILLATDPDREGEAIAWHLTEVLELEKSPKKARSVKRIVFHEITKDAITEALKHPRDIDQHLKRAQEARRVLDRLVGYDLSGLIWKKVRYGLSAGRVQSPALRILSEKEREVRAFVPEKYWILTAETKTARGKELLLTAAEELKDPARVREIEEKAASAKWSVREVKETNAKRSPNAPFTTSTLQQRASTVLGFSPSRAMRAAQKLYEAGLITYMRTDSTTIAEAAKEKMIAFIEKEFGANYAVKREYKTKVKNAQEAHEAIRPTDLSKKRAGSGADEKKLYELIWRRALASQAANAEFLRTKIIAETSDPTLPVFSATGARTTFDGWLRVDPFSKGEDVELPEVSRGEKLDFQKMITEEKETQPPPRYTEAGLVKELEKRGIGRPSTYASIIETLVKREYVNKEGRTLIPTETGEVVSEFLEDHFNQYISDTFTAEMENELDEIANGKRDYGKTLKDFYGPFQKAVEKKKKEVGKITNLGDAPAEFTCPKCNSPMIIKLGKSGKFMSCARFPDCDGARTMEGAERKGPEETGESCPECKEGKLISRHGKYGEFVGCNRYPKCKFVKNPEGSTQNGTGVICSSCNKGELVGKRGKFGPFYACSKYPDCRFSMKAKPTGEKCSLCGSLMMEGTKTIPERCSSKACPNHRPDKLKK